MASVRRAYVYLVAAISLEAAAWSVVGLLRLVVAGLGDVPRDGTIEAAASRLAVIVVAMPIYVAHWRWAQRLASRGPEERASAVRRVYLYGTMALFLVPLLANAYSLLERALLDALSASSWVGTALLVSPSAPPTELSSRGWSYALAPVFVFGALWLFHRRVVAEDLAAAGETSATKLVRRVYVLGFSAIGLALTGAGAATLLAWLLWHVGPLAAQASPIVFVSETARLAIGLPLWILYWRRSQRMADDDPDERASELRLFYLYAVVFVTVLIGVGGTSMVLAGLFRRLMGVPAGGDIREVLPAILVAGAGWLYHAQVIREESARAAYSSRQQGIRRLYEYLVAAAALSALVVGVGGVLTSLIRPLLGESDGALLRQQIAQAASLLVVGLVVWLPFWLRLERLAEARGAVGAAERSSFVRKLYLYAFLFVATMMILSGAVFAIAVAFQTILGGTPTGAWQGALSRSIASALTGAAVWLYHGSLVRADARRSSQDRADRQGEWPTIVLGTGDDPFDESLAARLRDALPGLPVAVVAEGTSGGAAEEPSLASARLVVTPWSYVEAALAEGGSDLRSALASAPDGARRLLVPAWRSDVDWAGTEYANASEMLDQCVSAIRQIVDGEPVGPSRRFTLAAAIGVAVAAIVMVVVGLQIFVTIIGPGGADLLFGG